MMEMEVSVVVSVVVLVGELVEELVEELGSNCCRILHTRPQGLRSRHLVESGRYRHNRIWQPTLHTFYLCPPLQESEESEESEGVWGLECKHRTTWHIRPSIS